MIRTCQPTFSAALIGYIEAVFADPEQKNALCQPVAKYGIDTDWLRMLAVTTRNRVAWRAHPNIEGSAGQVAAEHAVRGASARKIR